MLNVVTPGNLGNEFDLGVIEANKLHIKFDGTSVIRDPGTGTVYAAIYDPMPAGHIQVSKIALTGTATAYAQPTQINSTIVTYAWSGAGVTFASPSSPTTTYTVAASGEYTLQCTVTNSDAWFEVFTKVVKHDVIINVMGTDSEEDHFSTIASAYAWIVANVSSGINNYQVIVHSLTADTGTVTLPPTNTTSIIFKHAARAICNFDIGTAGTKIFIGEGNQSTSITGSAAGGPVFSGAGATLRLMNIAVVAVDAASHVVSMTSGSLVMLSAVVTQAAAAPAGINALNCTLTTCRLIGSFVSGSVYIQNAVFNNDSRDVFFQPISNNQTYGVWFDGCAGRISDVKLSVTTAASAPVGSYSHFKITKNTVAANSLILDSLQVITVQNATAGNTTTLLEVDGTGGSNLFIRDFDLYSIVIPAGTGYGILRTNTPTGNEIFVKGSIRAKTATVINLVAGVPTAWVAPVYGTTFMGSSPDANVTFSAVTSFGSNFRV